MALVGERIQCVVRVRPTGDDERAGEAPCIQLRGDEIVVLPVGQELPVAGATSPARSSASQAFLAGGGGAEPPRTPVSARRGGVPGTPTSRTPFAHTPAASPRVAPLDGSVAKAFAFDTVLPPPSSQDDVWRLCERFVDAPLEGYNACIFAYGQTGSGKTHTMLGTPESPGVIRRACARLFEAVALQAETEFHVSATYVELYNNEFRDLLDPENQPTRRRALPIELELARKRRPIALHETAAAAGQPPAVHLSGSDTLRTPVRSAAELLELVAYGSTARATAATKLNALSSRSHGVLTLHVESREPGAAVARLGKVHLVDLAGSENLTLSGAEGATRVEAQAINSSLSALADVLEALSKRGAGAHAPIPYRNHKLTRLLADSIGGNSKTLMLTTVLPFGSCHRQTLMAVHFAARARAIKPHAALVQNCDLANSGALATLKHEIATLRAKLAQRDAEIRMIEQNASARDEVHSEETARKLRHLEAARRQEEAALKQQMSEVLHLRSVERAEGDHRSATQALALALKDVEANRQAREQCAMLEQIESLQDLAESQQELLGQQARKRLALERLADEMRAHAADETTHLAGMLAGWEADRAALDSATARACALDADVASLRADLARQAADAQAAAAREGSALDALKGSAAAASDELAAARKRADAHAHAVEAAAEREGALRDELAHAREQAATAAKAAKAAAKTAAAREAELQAELALSRAALEAASGAALAAAKKKAGADEPSKALKKQLAELTNEAAKAKADARAARAAADAAMRDATDARDAADARAAADGTMRRRVALLEVRLRQGTAAFVELNACVAEARALPALQTRLRGIVATARLLTAPLPAAEGGAPPQPPPLPPVEAAPPLPPSPPPQSDAHSDGVSGLLGIRRDEQDARLAETMTKLARPPLAQQQQPAEAVADARVRSSKRSDRTSATPQPPADEPADDEPAQQPETTDAAARPSRRASKRAFTPEGAEDNDAAEERAEPKPKRAGNPAAKRRSKGKPDELVVGPALVTLTNAAPPRDKVPATAAAAGKASAAGAQRVVLDKENGQDAEVIETSKRRALFNPRRRASHAFSQMI